MSESIWSMERTEERREETAVVIPKRTFHALTVFGIWVKHPYFHRPIDTRWVMWSSSCRTRPKSIKWNRCGNMGNCKCENYVARSWNVVTTQFYGGEGTGPASASCSEVTWFIRLWSLGWCHRSAQRQARNACQVSKTWVTDLPWTRCFYPARCLLSLLYLLPSVPIHDSVYWQEQGYERSPLIMISVVHRLVDARGQMLDLGAPFTPIVFHI